MALTPFQQAVLGAVRHVPPGSVASYGQIAAAIGAPRAARQVGWTMRSMETTGDFPWWRIINNKGQITIKGNQFSNAQMQRELLEAEGVFVSELFQVDMGRYRHKHLIQTAQPPVQYQGTYD